MRGAGGRYMNEDFAMLLFLFAVSATANVALAVGLWRTARRLKRLERQPDPPLPPDERTERLEHVIEALSSQVDQLASGQDFLNRVVAERLDKLARGLPPPGGPARPER